MTQKKFDKKRRFGKKKTDQLMHDRRRERRQMRAEMDAAAAAAAAAAKEGSSDAAKKKPILSRMSEQQYSESSIPDDIFLKDMQRFQEYTEGLGSNAPEWLRSGGGQWKKVELHEFQDFGGMMGIEVLDAGVYEADDISRNNGSDGDDSAMMKKKKTKEGREELNDLEQSRDDGTSGEGHQHQQKKKKKRNRKKKQQQQQKETAQNESEGGTADTDGSVGEMKSGLSLDVDGSDDVADASGDVQSSRKKKKNKKRKRKEEQKENEVSAEEDEREEPFVFDEKKMAAWEPFAEVIHEDVLENLQKLGFVKPTPVQKQALELMVENPQRNVIAAAETGSGKTLAFGIPLVSAVLDEKDELQLLMQQEEGVEEGVEADDVDDLPEEQSKKRAKIDAPSESAVEDGQPPKNKWIRKTKIRALVLTPTRELAIQVANHLKAITKSTSIICAAIVGGMSIERQERILSYRPEIVVATPGRYWDLTQAGVQHLLELDQLRCVCIDEADRMLAEGHFEEVYNILGLVNKVRLRQESPPLLQKFVLSATLTLDAKWRGNSAGQQETSMVEKLLRILDLDDHTIIDLTPKGQMARTLQEAHVPCLEDEKDTHLYYLLYFHPGRTIVFCNSISAVRHLHTLLTMLKLPVYALHGEMQQKQRLKNLDRFRTAQKAILVATDVAARGLDIPNVDSVIHFQMPRTVETYVHRCGRTGRANKTGISVALISPEDRRNYVSICTATKKEDGMDEFPVQISIIKQMATRTRIAEEIARYEVDKKRKKTNADWFQKNAEAADIELDETFFSDLSKSEETDHVKTNRISDLKQRLKTMLSEQIVDPGISVKYVAADLDNLSRVQEIGREKTIEQAFAAVKQSEHSSKRMNKKKNKFRRFK